MKKRNTTVSEYNQHEYQQQERLQRDLFLEKNMYFTLLLESEQIYMECPLVHKPYST